MKNLLGDFGFKFFCLEYASFLDNLYIFMIERLGDVPII